jgi:hypothetical protein
MLYWGYGPLGRRERSELRAPKPPAQQLGQQFTSRGVSPAAKCKMPNRRGRWPAGYQVVLFIPVAAYWLANRHVIQDLQLHQWDRDRKRMSAAELEDRAAAMLLLKRLAAYTLFASVVFAMLLWPFYLGQGYIAVVTNTANVLAVSACRSGRRVGWM